ncbi:MAG: LytTR family DNA-binding domain-containing protein [Winogradskyella arenosi]
MNCIIIDDEKTSIDIILKLCSEIRGLNVKRAFINTTNALTYLEKNNVDFIFLDIHMPELSGFEFLDKFKHPPKIVLITSDTKQALKAFNYSCVVDYLGKPIRLNRFIQSIEKVERALRIDQNKYKSSDLYINFENKLVRIKINSIEIIKIVNKKTIICTTNHNYTVKSSLTKIFQKLPSLIFVRVHQSYIVNISKIVDIKSGSILINKELIPISRLRRSDLLERINLF